MIQLNFFQSFEEQILDENRFLKEEVKKVALKTNATHASADKVRRALFARNNELQKRVDELEERLKIIEKNICKGS